MFIPGRRREDSATAWSRRSFTVKGRASLLVELISRSDENKKRKYEDAPDIFTRSVVQHHTKSTRSNRRGDEAYIWVGKSKRLEGYQTLCIDTGLLRSWSSPLGRSRVSVAPHPADRKTPTARARACLAASSHQILRTMLKSVTTPLLILPLPLLLDVALTRATKG